MNSSGAAVPEQIQKRLKEWKLTFKLAHRAHYAIGTIGLLSGALSPLAGQYNPYLSVLAGLSAATVTFVQPLRIYRRYVSAWRMLDIAILRFESGDMSFQNLISSLETGEQIIQQTEEND